MDPESRVFRQIQIVKKDFKRNLIRGKIYRRDDGPVRTDRRTDARTEGGRTDARTETTNPTSMFF